MQCKMSRLSLQFGAEKEVNIRLGGHGGGGVGSLPFGVFAGIPRLGIDGFADAQVERHLRNNLPSETEVRSTAQTIGRRDGEGIEHVVLIGIDAVVPFAAVKPLEPEPQLQWYL